MRKVTGKAKGGVARAAALSKTERKEIAQRAADMRWHKDVPYATHDGTLALADIKIPCAVLNDNRRVLTQRGFLRAIGRGEPSGGRSQGTTRDGLPAFLSAQNLQPFISEELRRAATPIIFRAKKGGGAGGNRAFGYDAELLTQVCNVYLEARRQKALQAHHHQMRIADACEMLMRALAHIGIVALVDEATGFQEVRDKLALQAILDAFLRKELAAWAKRFPDEFYQHIFRLREWEWKGRGKNPPQVVASYTKDIVYARLAPHIMEELEKRNPISNGRRRGAHHQWLTEDVGHPALAQHLHAVITLMRVSKTWDQFKLMLDIAHPKRGDTLQLPLMAEQSRPEPEPKVDPKKQMSLFDESPSSG
jgi:hypothetical protein